MMQMTLRTIAVKSLVALTLSGGLWAMSTSISVAAEKVFYRYVNEQGVKVLGHSISPKYSQKGYEVVSPSGVVLKVVPAALTGEEAAKQESQRLQGQKLAAWDKELRRRYSKVDDIEATKKRKLSSLEANLSILRGNISSLKAQIQVQQGEAAALERGGRKIPESLLSNIRELTLELEDTEDLVRIRLLENEQISEKYDRDIARFREISQP